MEPTASAEELACEIHKALANFYIGGFRYETAEVKFVSEPNEIVPPPMVFEALGMVWNGMAHNGVTGAAVPVELTLSLIKQREPIKTR